MFLNAVVSGGKLWPCFAILNARFAKSTDSTQILFSLEPQFFQVFGETAIQIAFPESYPFSVFFSWV